MTDTIGLDPKRADESAQFAVGELGEQGSGEFVYLQNTLLVALDEGHVITISDEDATAKQIAKLSALELGTRIGVVCCDVPAGDYFWAQVRGSAKILVNPDTPIQSTVTASTIAGVVREQTRNDDHRIEGMLTTEAASQISQSLVDARIILPMVSAVSHPIAGTLITYDTHTADLAFTHANRPILALDVALPDDCLLIHFNFGSIVTGSAKSGENDTVTREQFLALDPWTISNDAAGTLDTTNLATHALVLVDWAGAAFSANPARRDLYLVRTADNRIGVAGKDFTEDALPATIRFEIHKTAAEPTVLNDYLEDYRGTLIVPDANGNLPPPTEDNFDDERIAAQHGRLLNPHRTHTAGHEADATFTNVANNTNIHFGGVNHRFRGSFSATTGASGPANPLHNDVMYRYTDHVFLRRNAVAGSPQGWYSQSPPDGFVAKASGVLSFSSETLAKRRVSEVGQYVVIRHQLKRVATYTAGTAGHTSYVWIREPKQNPVAIYVGRGQTQQFYNFETFPETANAGHRPIAVVSQNNQVIRDRLRLIFNPTPYKTFFGGDELDIAFRPAPAASGTVDPSGGCVLEDGETDEYEDAIENITTIPANYALQLSLGIWKITAQALLNAPALVKGDLFLKQAIVGTDDVDHFGASSFTSGHTVFSLTPTIFDNFTHELAIMYFIIQTNFLGINSDSDALAYFWASFERMDP